VRLRDTKLGDRFSVGGLNTKGLSHLGRQSQCARKRSRAHIGSRAPIKARDTKYYRTLSLGRRSPALFSRKIHIG
jgi:hypothetical protein